MQQYENRANKPTDSVEQPTNRWSHCSQVTDNVFCSLRYVLQEVNL